MNTPAETSARATRPGGAMVVLLAKDLRRAWRNPIGFLIHLAVPLVLTALIGLAVGGAGSGGSPGRIRLGLVDEDESMLTSMLRGAFNQGQGVKHFEPVFLDHTNALEQLGDGQLSAVVILPAGFTRDFLTGHGPITLRLVKNPAQAYHPAIVEELLATLTTGLNSVARALGPELGDWQALWDGPEAPAVEDLTTLFRRTGTRVEAIGSRLRSSTIWYRKAEASTASGQGGQPGRGFNIFSYLLPGMAALFLLFMADNALRDLYREERWRTFDRFRTLRASLLGFVVAKGLFTLMILLMGSVILFGGGVVLFDIHWAQPGSLGTLVLAYAVFATGFMALVTAVAGTERRADTFNTIAAMALGLAGGCMFPPQQLPALFRDHLTPLMPTSWFASAARGLALNTPDTHWALAAAALAALGFGCVLGATALFQRRLERGIRA